VGATVLVHTKAIDKFGKRDRRCVRHEATVTDVATGKLYFTEIRDILSLCAELAERTSTRAELNIGSDHEGTTWQLTAEALYTDASGRDVCTYKYAPSTAGTST
jgi:hypothetical protein